MHFQHGLPHNRLQVLDFGMGGHLYSVVAMIQYITNPYKHFIVWLRQTKSKLSFVFRNESWGSAAKFSIVQSVVRCIAY